VTQIGVDLDALRTGASQLGAAAESFSQGSAHARGIPSAPAPLNADGLLERAAEALGGALGKLASELDHVSTHLSGTAAVYEETERMLAAWFVPGGS
jgi:hypothetical protein